MEILILALKWDTHPYIKLPIEDWYALAANGCQWLPIIYQQMTNAPCFYKIFANYDWYNLVKTNTLFSIGKIMSKQPCPKHWQ